MLMFNFSIFDQKYAFSGKFVPKKSKLFVEAEI